MSTNINWKVIALRIVLTIVAAALIGFNREAGSRPAGLRTTLLVALAACMAMLQANILLDTRGKTADSFIVLDLMRFPLGILSGMGFIGAGAIVRKGNLVAGVTTAATLWFVTVMGLCFGGGQILLGSLMALLGWVILQALKWFENLWQHDQRANLTLLVDSTGPHEAEISQLLKENGYSIDYWAVSYMKEGECREMRCGVLWHGPIVETSPPGFLRQLAARPGLMKLKWSP
jgi:putative Mg2+ transporter-C (MgtC) family protein